jgi:hypothetical protein
MIINQRITLLTAFSLSLLLILVYTTLTSSASCASGLEPLDPADKSPEKAVRSSLLATVIPVAAGGAMLWAGLKSEGNYEILTGVGAVTGVLGVAVGPSVGHAYAERPGRGAAGVGLRLVTSLAGSLLTLVSVRNVEVYDAPDRTDATGLTLGVILFGVTAISAVHDIISAGDSAKEYNSKRSATTIQMAPTYFTNSAAPGLALTIDF